MDTLQFMLHALTPLDPRPLRQVDHICTRCGAKAIHLTRDPHALAEVRGVCDRCAESDKPPEYPETGW